VTVMTLICYKRFPFKITTGLFIKVFTKIGNSTTVVNTINKSCERLEKLY